MNLRDSDSKLRRQILQLQEKVRRLEGKRRFNPSRAFQKENVENEERVPLKGTGYELEYCRGKVEVAAGCNNSP